MTARSYFGKMNSTLGSVVPLAMFISGIGGTLLSSIVIAVSSLFSKSTKLSGQDDGNDDENHLAKVICHALKLTKRCKIFFLPTIPEEKANTKKLCWKCL